MRRFSSTGRALFCKQDDRGSSPRGGTIIRIIINEGKKYTGECNTFKGSV